MKFKFLKDVAVADVAFEAYGDNLNELLESGALALTSVMVDLKSIKKNIKKEVKLNSKDVEGLFYDFLSEIIYLKDAEQLLFSFFKVDVDENKMELKAELEGDKIDYNKQVLDKDVKAVTYHLFKIEKLKKGYKATVVLDI